jgi:4-hydroxybutyrate CoA-transferase
MAVVALPSTAQRGTASRIVAQLGPAVPVTVCRHLADRVVTEHGVARLRGADLSERRDRLSTIADEVFRPVLRS